MVLINVYCIFKKLDKEKSAVAIKKRKCLGRKLELGKNRCKQNVKSLRDIEEILETWKSISYPQ